MVDAMFDTPSSGIKDLKISLEYAQEKLMVPVSFVYRQANCTKYLVERMRPRGLHPFFILGYSGL